MISLLKAVAYFLWHPFDPVYLTIVRRYVDAQGHFIGELYDGHGRAAKMIGMSCDNLALEVAPDALVRVRWGESFLDAMSANTVRTGGAEPQENARVHAYVSMRRFCPMRVTFLNRFVEHILDNDYA